MDADRNRSPLRMVIQRPFHLAGPNGMFGQVGTTARMPIPTGRRRGCRSNIFPRTGRADHPHAASERFTKELGGNLRNTEMLINGVRGNPLKPQTASVTLTVLESDNVCDDYASTSAASAISCLRAEPGATLRNHDKEGLGDDPCVGVGNERLTNGIWGNP